MRTKSTAAVVLSLLALPAALAGQDTEWNRYTLEGLDGVYVRGEAGDACQATGFTMGTIEAVASAQLIEAEVPVLTEQEMLASPGLPELRITVECAASGDQVAFSASVRVQQATQMIRDTQITLSEAVTWYATSVGIAGASDAQGAIEEALRAKLDEFLTAFQAANEDDEGVGRG